MSLEFDAQYVAHDTVDEAIDVDANDGVTTDDDGDYQFDWGAIPTVDATDIPDSYTSFYDVESFHVIRDVTVAKPIKQQYRINGDDYTFKKTEDELRKAAWTFDNAPHPLDHPDTGVVKATDDIHGFWKDARYEDGEGIVANMYLPSNDDDALEYVSAYGDVSIGFYNRLASADESGVDAVQTDIIGDHIASVRKGRCSGEDGCGLNADAANRAVLADDGSLSTVNDSEDSNTMTDSTGDCGCSGDGDGTISLGDAIPGMSVDALAERNDSVSELVSEKEELQSDAEELRDDLETVREALSADEDTDLASEIESLTERLEDAEEELEDKRREDFDSLVSDITEMTDKTEDDFDFEEDSVEDLREKKDWLESIDREPTTANPDSGTTTDSSDSTDESDFDMYDEQY